MVSLSSLEQKYPKDAGRLYNYLKHKNRGGINNSKGNTFENFFAVYLIAKLFNDGFGEERTRFSSQTFSFIDDLVIERGARKNHHRKVKSRVDFFQIKDTTSLKWTDGNGPLQKDFEVQYNVTPRHIKANLFLVVSGKALQVSLKNSLPLKLKRHSKVLHFKPAGSINNLIKDNTLFKSELEKMCAVTNPTTDKLEAIGSIVLGVWDATNKQKVKLKDILSSCYNLNPHFIKGFSERISSQLAHVLNSVKGLRYKIQGGYLLWNFGNTDNGIVPHVIGSRAYIQMENDIISLGSNVSFENIEPYLT